MSELTFEQPGDVPPLRGDCYVETGFGLCSSLRNALAVKDPVFSSLMACDTSEAFFKRASGDEALHDPRLMLVHGCSVEFLPQTIRLGRKTVFWLDSHIELDSPDCWCPAHGQCPLLKELKIIALAPWQVKPILLIDDCSVFLSDHWWQRRGADRGHLKREDWPTMGQIYDVLDGSSHRWSFHIDGEILYVF